MFDSVKLILTHTDKISLRYTQTYLKTFVSTCKQAICEKNPTNLLHDFFHFLNRCSFVKQFAGSFSSFMTHKRFNVFFFKVLESCIAFDFAAQFDFKPISSKTWWSNAVFSFLFLSLSHLSVCFRKHAKLVTLLSYSLFNICKARASYFSG